MLCRLRSPFRAPIPTKEKNVGEKNEESRTEKCRQKNGDQKPVPFFIFLPYIFLFGWYWILVTPKSRYGIGVTLPVTTNCPVTTLVVLASARPVKPGCLPPTLTVNSPGSMTRLPLSSMTVIRSAPISNETVCFSPGLREIRLIPARDLI